jgi:predicted dehydrogenase
MSDHQNQPEQSGGALSRRQFLHASAAVSASAMAASLGPVAHAQGSGKLRVGLIGCGGRGTGAAIQHLQGNDNVTLVAMGDLFGDKLNGSRQRIGKENGIAKKVEVSDDTCFVGWDAYQKVIDSGVDTVILATPPQFRPRHLRAAIEAGKHVFMEKPVCVDPVGARHVIKSSEMAKQKGLAIVAGTQRRHDAGYRKTIEAIQDGIIGDIRGGQCYWTMGELWHRGHKSQWSDMEYQVRNWLYFTWLSGDHIVEQHVHNIDIINWILGGPPESAFACGGRQVRTGEKWGEVWDHFSTDFDYGNGVHVHSMCRQHDGTTRRVAEHVTGTKGHADPAGRVFLTTGGSESTRKFKAGRNPYVQEHINLVDSIRSGQPLNEGKRVAESCLTAIMARMSAYTGKQVSWDWVFNASELDLSPEQYAFGSAPTPDVAIPGQTPLV